MCGVVLQRTKAEQGLFLCYETPKICPKMNVLVSCEIHLPRKKIVEEKPPKAVVGVVVVRYLSDLFTRNRGDAADDVQLRNLRCLTKHQNHA